MAPDVSFIIAAYNAEATIADAIESALSQTGVAVEVIVVDDCSSDRTCAVASTFDQSHVHVVPLQTNQGPGGARNVGFQRAQGRWIAVLDSDDVVLPGRALKMIQRAEQSGAQAVVDNILIASGRSTERTLAFPRHALASRPELTLADFIDHNMIFSTAPNFGYFKPLFQRDFIRTHGHCYHPQLRIGEDYLLLASLLASGGRCAVEPEAGYIYHSRPGSISHMLLPEHVAGMLAADREFVARFKLDTAAASAQARRTKNLGEAASFLTLVDHIKQKDFGGIAGIALRHPVAFRHLRMPIKMRLSRWWRAVPQGADAVPSQTGELGR